MRVYREEKLEKIYCNKCGRKIEMENEIVREGIFSTTYRWDYFSMKDGMQHSFDICEGCYDKMVKEFVIPVLEEEYTELL